VPLDHWLGTYARDEADFEKRFLGLKEEPGEGGAGGAAGAWAAGGRECLGGGPIERAGPSEFELR
jgi:hypothetical protein